MDSSKEKEKSLREYAAIGDSESIIYLIKMGTDVNSKNSVNGWTALHWASKRNHTKIVELLLQHGADKTLTNSSNELPMHLARDNDLKQILDTNVNHENYLSLENDRKPTFIPNYLKYPKFVYSMNVGNFDKDYHDDTLSAYGKNIIIKVRIAHLKENDFIEIEYLKANMNFHNFVNLICQEFKIDEMLKSKLDTNDYLDLSNYIVKIRKLPNILIRNDNEVERILTNQEFEIVLQKDFLALYEGLLVKSQFNPFNILSGLILKSPFTFKGCKSCLKPLNKDRSDVCSKCNCQINSKQDHRQDLNIITENKQTNDSFIKSQKFNLY